MTQTYEEKRVQFLSTVEPGDFASWTTFDGSSVYEVVEVTDDEIVLGFENGRTSRWPRSGTIHYDYYGGFDERIGPANESAIERFLSRRYRGRLGKETADMDATELKRVVTFCEGVKLGRQYG